MTFFVKCLVAEGGYTPPEAGQLFMVMGWCSLACGLLWGHISDVIGRKGAMCLVFLVHTVSFGLYGLYPHPLGFTISAALFGLTAWSIPAIVAAACGDMLGSRLAPAALGLVTLCFGTAQALGPLAAGMLADARGTLYPAMVLAAVVALAGALLSLTLPGMHRHGTLPAATAPPGTPPPPG
jgi:MFS family permease